MRGGGENSPVRVNILREGLKLEGDYPPLPGFPRSFPPMVGSMINIRQSVLDLDRNPTDGKRQSDPETLDELTKFAKSVGADEIGYASVPQEWLFQDTAIRYTQAIVLVMEMDKERMSLAPNRDIAVMVHETYNALGQISNKIVDWLQWRFRPSLVNRSKNRAAQRQDWGIGKNRCHFSAQDGPDRPFP